MEADDGVEAGEAVVNGGDRTMAVAGNLRDGEVFEAVELDDGEECWRAGGRAWVETLDKVGEGAEGIEGR
ncbi:MAG: hypothetical protein C5B50_29045 [Verrucomicrobia bacterium]|nr:MAG: hypothetical protein C5B50_29045 [Verrucomicrobiota bacterium]